MTRKFKTKAKEPSLPVKCKKCGFKFTDYALDVEHPVCPECHEPIKMPDIPPAPITGNENKPDKQTPPPPIEIAMTTGDGHTITGQFTDYGIKARVPINEIHNLAFNKIGLNADGKMIVKISFEAETSSDSDGINGISEPSIFRIIHMMQQHAKMGAIITCSKLQTDFLDILDPVSNKRILAQVTQKDLEDRGFGQVRAITNADKAANKAIEDARIKKLDEENDAAFNALKSANPENPDNKPVEVAHLEEPAEAKV